jgi:hypothetical protein
MRQPGQDRACQDGADNTVGSNATQDFTLNVSSSTGGSAWSVSPGGDVSGSSSTFTIKDGATGTVFTCKSSKLTGTLKTGGGLSGTDLGTVTALTTSTCTGPLSLTFAMTFGGLPWPLNTISYGSGVTSGTITGIHAILSGPGCTATLDGTSATSDNGETSTSYTNSTGQLALLASGGSLTIYNVSGCAGLINSGDAATVSATYKIAPKQTITSS